MDIHKVFHLKNNGGGAGYPDQEFAQPVINNYHLEQPDRSGDGSGLTNALLLGALYGALKPKLLLSIKHNTVTKLQVPAGHTDGTTAKYDQSHAIQDCLNYSGNNERSNSSNEIAPANFYTNTTTCCTNSAR